MRSALMEEKEQRARDSKAQLQRQAEEAKIAPAGSASQQLLDDLTHR
jgi:hypothetical protein